MNKSTSIVCKLALMMALGASVRAWAQDVPPSEPDAKPVEAKAKSRKKTPLPPEEAEVVDATVTVGRQNQKQALQAAQSQQQQAFQATQDALRAVQDKFTRTFPVPPVPPEPVMDFAGFDGANPFTYTARAAAPALIVQNAPDAGSQSEWQEDLAIMSRLFAKAAAKEGTREPADRVMGIVVSMGGAKPPQSFYLEGYGAMFLLSVKYPLVAPPATEEPKPDAPVNSAWEETKQELFGGNGNARLVARLARDERPVEYDADKVEDLKGSLLEAFKNAAKIRHLKPEESVVVAVNGGGTGGGGPMSVRTIVSGDAKLATYQNRVGKMVTTATNQSSPAKTTTLTLRAKKSDIDAFASGKTTLEDFKRTVQVQAY